MSMTSHHLRQLGLWSALAFVSLGLAGSMAMAAGVVQTTEPTIRPSVASPTLPVVPSIAKPARLLFVGDIMLGRAVETLMRRHGQDYPFAKLGDFLTAPDLTVANLEGPIPAVHQQTPDESLLFSFPATSGSVLAQQGIDAVSLSNNHSLDQGAAGYTNTRSVLTTAGVDSFGEQRRVSDSTRLEKTVKGRRVILLGFHDATSRLDQVAAIEAVQTAATGPDAFVVVFIHWGTEYRPTATDRQRQLAHGFIDAGADAVIGHHPHVVEDVEVYKDTFIAYSLGNFVFDQYFSVETQQELGVGVTLDDTAVTYTLWPLESVRSQPALMIESRRQQFLDQLAERSPAAIAEAVIAGTIRLARHQE